MRSLRSLAIAAFAAGGIASAAALTIDPAQHAIDGVRDARYCEIIPVVRRGIHLVATVYNTLGLNDCPPAIWDKITEAAMKKRFGAHQGRAQRPAPFRHGCDRGRGRHCRGQERRGRRSGADRAGDHQPRSARAALAKPYRERTIDRETRYVFGPASRCSCLVRPDGVRYAMQSYAQMIDKCCPMTTCPALGSRLKLPAGWRYEVMMPDADLVLGAQGQGDHRAGRSRRHLSEARLSGGGRCHALRAHT